MLNENQSNKFKNKDELFRHVLDLSDESSKIHQQLDGLLCVLAHDGVIEELGEKAISDCIWILKDLVEKSQKISSETLDCFRMS